LGIVGAVGLATGCGDVDGLFPRLGGLAWDRSFDGGWESVNGAIRIDASGTPSLVPPLIALPEHPALELVVEQPDVTPIVVSEIWLSVVLADWTTEPMSRWARLLGALAAGGMGLVLLHMLAAERAVVWVLLGVPLPILLQTWWCRGFRAYRFR